VSIQKATCRRQEIGATSLAVQNNNKRVEKDVTARHENSVGCCSVEPILQRFDVLASLQYSFENNVTLESAGNEQYCLMFRTLGENSRGFAFGGAERFHHDQNE
jgi:hypothetical protein